MVDLKRLLVPVATGAIGAKLSLMAKEKEQEDTAIQEAEGVTDALVEDTIVTARSDINSEKNIQNQTYDLMVNNYNTLKNRFGPDKEDDLALLYFKNRSLFKAQDITQLFPQIDSLIAGGLTGDITGEGTERTFVPGGDITAETPQIQSIYEVYGQGATTGDIIRQQRDAYNKQVNAGLANLAGENNTKLFIDKTVQPGMVRERTLQQPQFQEGRVTQEQFMTSINEIVDKATMQNLPDVNLSTMARTVNWSPVLSKEDLDMAALNAVGGTGNEAELLRSKYKFSYLVDAARTMQLQNQNVETIGEAIDIMRANGTISKDSVMNSLTALERATIDYSNNMMDEVRKDTLNPDAQIINRYYTDPEGTIEIQGVEFTNKSLYDDLTNRYQEQARIEYTNQGYYDLFNRFVNVGDDPQFNVKLIVPVRENEGSPFVDKQMTGAINPQILSDGGLQVVDPKDIYQTIDVVDSRDLFGVYSPDGSRQLKPGDSGVFANMTPDARENLKEQIMLNSGGMDAIMPFLTMSQEEFKAYQEAPKEDSVTDVIPTTINRDNYEDFLPPSKLNLGNTKEPNPELISWASENMSAWESFVNSLPNEKPQKSDYPEDEQGLDQQYGEDLRFYNKVVRNLKRQLPKIQKLVKDRE